MTETTHDLAWRELGNCVGVDPDLFFGGRGDNKSHAAAKRVCAGCEVRDECQRCRPARFFSSAFRHVPPHFLQVMFFSRKCP